MPKKKILVIDDSPIVAAWVETVLHPEHDVVVHAGTRGTSATVVREKPDLVLVDTRVPVLGDRDVVGLIRGSDDGRAARVVLFSGASLPELAAAALACGADGYIQKTGDAAAFAAQVRGALGGARKSVTQLGAAAAADAPAAPAKIIIVADPTEEIDLGPLLARRDLRVIRVRSAAETREVILSAKPALLVLGPELPDASAPSLATRVRSSGAMHNLGILFVRGTGNSGLAEPPGVPGANIILAPPYSSTDFTAAVAKLANVAPRKAARLLVRLDVSFAAYGGFQVGFTRNISVSGMLLEAQSGVNIGDLLRLKFFVPDCPHEAATPATVVRVHERAADKLVVGVQFAELSPESAKAIADFVAAVRHASPTV
jgi:DNA-binding response OmpR family regulator